MIEGQRAVKKEDLPSLIHLLDTVFRPNGGDMQADYPQLFRPENLKNLQVMVEDGRVIAHMGIIFGKASIYGCQVSTGSIGAVATSPAYRGKGLASKLLLKSFKEIEKAGGALIFISGNRGLYLRNNCMPVVRAARFEINKSFADDHASDNLILKALSTGEIPDILNLYSKTPSYFLRRTEDWEDFLKSGMAMNRASDLWVIKRDRQIKAYVLAQRASASSPPCIIEYAGDRQAVIHSFSRIIAESRGKDSLILYIPVADTYFYRYFKTLGVSTEEWVDYQSTVRIQNFINLFRCMRPYFTERLNSRVLNGMRIKESESMITFSVGEEKLKLTKALATVLVFGSSDRNGSNILKRNNGFIENIFNKLFPIPAPWYGLNYI